MCTGCDQLPEVLTIVQISHEPCLGVAVGFERSANSPFTVQPPLERSKRNVRFTAAAISLDVGRGRGRIIDSVSGSTLGSGAFVTPCTLNFNTATPGSIRL